MNWKTEQVQRLYFAAYNRLVPSNVPMKHLVHGYDSMMRDIKQQRGERICPDDRNTMRALFKYWKKS